MSLLRARGLARPTGARSVASFVFLLSMSASLVGCESKLPGPMVCEEMATRWIGRSTQEIEASPRATQAVKTLINSCLTTPFDQQSVRCLEESRSLVMCLEDLARRHPERKPALRELLSRFDSQRRTRKVR